jgi:histone-lysine N-methyltransferase SETMAR
LSVRKLIAPVLWERKCVLMVELCLMGPKSYQKWIAKQRKITGRAIQNKRRGMLTTGVVLLCDNARLHTAAHTRALPEHFNWDLFDHPPYSPDLALSDYHQFTYLKN